MRQLRRIDAATKTVRAACVACGACSTRMQGRYIRRLVDVRLGGHEVLFSAQTKPALRHLARRAKARSAEPASPVKIMVTVVARSGR